MCNRRLVRRVVRGKTIRRQSPVPRRGGLQIPGLLAAELRLSIGRSLGIERRLRRGKNLSIERWKRSGGRLGQHVRLSLPALLRARHWGRQRRWWRRQQHPQGSRSATCLPSAPQVEARVPHRTFRCPALLQEPRLPPPLLVVAEGVKP